MSLSKPMQIATAATAAGVGGALATAILYPLDTLKTRMQSKACTPSRYDEDQEKREGAKATAPPKPLQIADLYRGLPFKTAQSATSKFLYFCVYTLLSQLASSAKQDDKPLSTLTNLVLGYFSELLHLPVTIPMEVIGTRLQTQDATAPPAKDQEEPQVGAMTCKRSRICEIVRAIKTENGGSLCGLYKGLHAYFVLCLQPAIQYTAFEKLKAMYLQHSKQAAVSLSALEAFVLGALARSLATLLLYPYIRAKVLLQAASRPQVKKLPQEESTCPHAEESKPKDGIVSIIGRVVRDEGVLALYRGLAPELTRGALSSALMLMIKEKIQMYVTMAFIIMSSMRQR